MSVSLMWSALVVTSLLVVVAASPVLSVDESTDQVQQAPADPGQADVTLNDTSDLTAAAAASDHRDVTRLGPVTSLEIRSDETQTNVIWTSYEAETITFLERAASATSANETELNYRNSNPSDSAEVISAPTNIPGVEAVDVEFRVAHDVVLHSNMTQAAEALSHGTDVHNKHSNASMPDPAVMESADIESADKVSADEVSADIDSADKVSADIESADADTVFKELFAQYLNSSAENKMKFNRSILFDEHQLQKLKVQMRTDPRVGLTVPELMKYYGYDTEIHHVTTSDGYILELHRVLGKQARAYSCASPLGRKTSTVGKCQPVLLQHGLLGTSSAWVMNEPSKALAYILSDHGYDVWMGNSRGNIYSLKHTYLDPDSKQFWDFTFSEMGEYDLPAVISYILKNNGNPKLHYVGHSMGTTMYWVMEHEQPYFSRSRVASMSALGPVAYVQHVKSPIMVLAPFHKELGYFLMDVMKQYRFLDPDAYVMELMQATCTDQHLPEDICTNSIFLLIGFDEQNLDMDWLPVILSSLNGGTSTKTIIHFAQMIDSGRFAKYDYGMIENLKKYNSIWPSLYSLKKVTTPVMLKWAYNDWLATPKDVKRLKKELTSSDTSNVPCENTRFNHLDFLWGKDAVQQVHNDVRRYLRINA